MKLFLFMSLLVASNILLAETRTQEDIELNFTGNDFYCLTRPNEKTQMIFKNSQISEHTGHQHDYLTASFGTPEMCLDAIQDLNNEYRGKVTVKLVKDVSTNYRNETYTWHGTCIRRGGHDGGGDYPCTRTGTRQVSIYKETVSVDLADHWFSHSL